MMQTDTHTQVIAPNPRNFWLFWPGQIISSLGSSVTAFALPLLVFRLTGSALNLAFSTMLTLRPYLCFGLIVGAWVDRGVHSGRFHSGQRWRGACSNCTPGGS